MVGFVSEPVNECLWRAPFAACGTGDTPIVVSRSSATSSAGLPTPGYPASLRSIGSPASDSTYAQSRTPGTGS